MATSSKTLCAICEGQHLTKCADHWCPECDEGLCNDCEKYHRLSKATRNHALMSIDDYKKLPADISKISHHCEDHGKKFQNFCPHHQQLCCPTCISVNHKSCSGLVDLDDVVKTSKTSTLIENLELSIIELGKHIETITQDRQQNLTQIEGQRRRLQEEIKQKREEINCLLDKLETTLINELVEAENKIKLEIESLLSKLEEKNEAVGLLQSSIVTIKTHSTDLQTFMGCKTLSEQVSKEEKYIESLSENGSLQQISLKCNISHKVSDILTAVTEFGSISVSYNPPLVLLKREQNKHAQIISPVELQPTKTIDQVSLTVSKKLVIPKGDNVFRLTGMDISPNGKVMIVDCDENKRLIIFTSNGYLDRIISLAPDQPYDITCINDEMVAVSIWEIALIKLVDIVSGTVSRTLKTNYIVDGIIQHHGTLVYCGRNQGLIALDPNSMTSTTVVSDAISSMNHVTAAGDNVYHSNRCTHTVTCYRTNGEKVWDFKDTRILQRPCGITVDNYSNVYVASKETNSVVIISPDGKHSKQILNEDDGLDYPRELQCDRNRNVLIVACYSGDVRLYNIS